MAGKGAGRPCRDGFECGRPDCYFEHPDGRRIDGAAKGKGKGPVLCRDGFECTRPDCRFEHPDGRRVDGAGKGKGKGPAPCHHGFECTRPDCRFEHPDGRRIDGAGKGKGKGPAPCHHGFECTRPDCRFEHPDGRRIDADGLGGKGDGKGEGKGEGKGKGKGEGKGEGKGDGKGQGKGEAPVVPQADLYAGRPVDVPVGGEAAALLQDGLLYHVKRYFTGRGVGCRLDVGRLVLFLPDGADERELQMEAQEELLRLISLRVELTERIQVRQRVVKRLIGVRGSTHQLLVRDLGVRIEAQNAAARDDPEALGSVEVTGPPEVLERIRPQLEAHLFSFDGARPNDALAEQQLAQERRDTVHLFVDNSNLAIGCQFLPTGRRDFSQRLGIKALAARMAGQRRVARAVVVGSKPPRTHGIWSKWEQAGFEVLVEWRDPESGREQFVDARLVAEAQMHVLNLHTTGQPPGILVLGTGDGNTDGQVAGTTSANFQNLVRTVARLGWRVEVWAWRVGCHPCYHRMARDPDLHGRVKVCFLDGFRDKITFGKERRLGAVADEDDDEADLCVMCLSNAPTHGFRPCGHDILCEQCLPDVLPFRGQPPLGDCFVCRRPWESVEPRR